MTLNDLSQLQDLSEQIKRREQILTLLPEGDFNLAKLELIVAKSKDKLSHLRSQWKEHKGSLELEHEELQTLIKQQQVWRQTSFIKDYFSMNIFKAFSPLREVVNYYTMGCKGFVCFRLRSNSYDVCNQGYEVR